MCLMLFFLLPVSVFSFSSKSVSKVANKGQPSFKLGEALVDPVPYYPSKALESKESGYVTMKFDINTQGYVESIEAHPEGMFEQSAIFAVEQFTYAPKIVKGEAVVVKGVKHRMTFELAPKRKNKKVLSSKVLSTLSKQATYENTCGATCRRG